MNAREFEDPSFICCCPEACTHTNSTHIDAACGKAEQLVRREHTLENDAIERKTLTDEHERNKKKTAAKCAREKKCCGQKWRPIYRLPSRLYLFNQRLFAFAAFASNLKRFIALYQTCNVILYTTCTYGCVLCVLCMLCLLNCVVE